MPGQELSAPAAIQPANRGGRPTLYRQDYCAQLQREAEAGGTLTSFAATIGVSRNTISLWAQRHPEFGDAIGQAKAKMARWWEARLRTIAEGGGGPGASAAVIFALKNLAPDDWQDRQTHEHVGKVAHAHYALTREEALEEAARRGLPTRIFEE
jgi:transposase